MSSPDRPFFPPRGAGVQRVFLLRHGEIQSPSSVKRYVGQTDLPLSEAGRQTAHRWAGRFSGSVFSGLFCSDLVRSRETAEIVGHGRPTGIEPIPGLREIHMGRWENEPFDAVRARFPEAFRRRGEHMDTFRPPGGESFRDLQQRAVAAFDGIVGRTPGDLLIIGHAGVNRALLCHVLGLPLARLFRLGQDYGCLNILERRKRGFAVALLNAVSGPI